MGENTYEERIAALKLKKGGGEHRQQQSEED
jgi:hypothetical protein